MTDSENQRSAKHTRVLGALLENRSAGTPGPWVATATPDLSLFVCLDDEDHTLVATLHTDTPQDALRIALLPELEDACLRWAEENGRLRTALAQIQRNCTMTASVPSSAIHVIADKALEGSDA